MTLAFEPQQSNPNLCSQARLNPKNENWPEGGVWVVPALPFTAGGTSSKSLDLWEPQCPHLKKCDNSCLLRLC